MLLCLGVMGLGCASSSPEATTFEPTVAAAPPPTVQSGPVEIGTMQLRELAPGAELELIADGPLVWTQYRDAEDNLVVELPNTVLGAALDDLTPAEGLVSAVEVETEANGERPLTRLVIRTRQEAEHSLVVDERVLNLRLKPVGADEPPTLAFEPVQPREEPVELAQRETEPAAATQPEQERAPPPPSGMPATRLDGVELVMAGETTVVRVVGDGEFDYSTFTLDNPPRFVIDLNGVVNASSRSVVPVESEAVEQVRMAQFRPYPDAVARVVFDLSDGASPVVDRAGDGLTVRFGPAPAGMAAETAVAEAALLEEAPPPVFEEPEVDEEPMLLAQAQEEEPDFQAPLPPLEQEREEMLPVEEVAPAIQPPPPPRTEPTSDVRLFESQEVPPIAPAEQTRTEVVPFGVRQVTSDTQWVGEPISMSLKDADITEVLRSIARISNLNIVIQPGVSGPVTVELDRVPWDQALDQILKINNLGMQLEGNILRIAPISQLRSEAQEQQLLQQAKALSVPLRTVLKRVSYADAQDVATLLTTGVGQDDRFGGLPTGIMSQRGTVSVDERTNTLIIKELPDFLDAVIQIIENLDVPEKQVMIEARIVETTRNFDRSLGIDWSFSGISSAATGNTTGLEFPNNGSVNGGVQLLTGGQNGFLNIGLGNVLNTFELDLTLNAAESDGLVNIISTPKVATLNNETAFIQSGLQIPIQTVANNTVTVQFVNATLRLQVTPQVTADGTILMDINIQKREPQLAFAVAGATNAPIATREARTRVIVRDGGTTVIGGIYEVSNDQGEDRVPGLANVPILGKLFRNKRRSTDNEELLIFITPRVIQL